MIPIKSNPYAKLDRDVIAIPVVIIPNVPILSVMSFFI